MVSWRIEFLDAGVEVGVQVFLVLLGVGDLVGEDFDLAAQARDFLHRLFVLVQHVDADRFVGLRVDAGIDVACQCIDLGAQVENRPAGFIVVEQAGVRVQGQPGGQGKGDGGETELERFDHHDSF
jgi:hypothetical protein